MQHYKNYPIYASASPEHGGTRPGWHAKGVVFNPDTTSVSRNDDPCHRFWVLSNLIWGFQRTSVHSLSQFRHGTWIAYIDQLEVPEAEGQHDEKAYTFSRGQ